MSLLNLYNVPGQMISGMDGNLLDWVTDQSNYRFLDELNCSFDNNLLQIENDIEVVDLSNEIQEALNKIEKDSIPASTKSQMQRHTLKFRKFLEDKNLDTRFENVPSTILNKYLRYFYSELSKEDGTPYAPASLICIRASIQRHLTSSENCVSPINIISGIEFVGANRMLKAMVGKYLKSEKRQKPEEKFPPIEENDMIKIRASFTRTNPNNLQNEFMFNCLYHFGLRGRETLTYLDKNAFQLKTDSQQRRYIVLEGDRLSKNCKASLKPKDFEDARKTRVYECDREEECPVRCFELYMSKLSPNNEELFQKPLSKPSKDQWFCSNRTLGKNYIGNLMSILSENLQLSKRYTNHCVRVTNVSVLRESGYTNEQIASVTGHKNPNSVQRYAKKRRDDSFYQPSEALQAGSSASVSRKVVPMGNGKITVTEKTANITTSTTNTGSVTPKIEFLFTGHFVNCAFNLQNGNSL